MFEELVVKAAISSPEGKKEWKKSGFRGRGLGLEGLF